MNCQLDDGVIDGGIVEGYKSWILCLWFHCGTKNLMQLFEKICYMLVMCLKVEFDTIFIIKYR